MATAAQCIANAENAQHSTGPKTEEGKAKVAKNGIRHGLFAEYERLAPADSVRIGLFIEEMHAGLPEQCPVREDIIRQYAIAKWRNELFFRMESSFFTSAIADERAKPESAGLIEQHGEDVLLGYALRNDAAGPNVFTKLMRYGAGVKKELRGASDAYLRLLDQLELERNRANPISQAKTASPQQETPETPGQTPRNAPCPCGSGIKFKRCCGAGAPAVLCAA